MLVKKLMVSASACIAASFGATCHGATFYFGVGTHIGQNKMNASEAKSVYALGGFNSFRDESFWHRVEKSKGEFEFPQSLTDLDEAVTAVKGKGGYPMIVLDYSNMYYDLGDIPRTDAGIAGFANYVKFTVEHYKGRAPLFEVWNEWNIGMGSNRKPRTVLPVENYIRLLRPTIAAVRSVDPSAKVIAGSVAGLADKWIDEFISQGGLKGIDGFSVHPYVFDRPGQNRPEDASDWLNKLSAKLTAANQGKPLDIYVTEIGWPNHSERTGWTEQQSADFLLRFYMLARAQPTIRGVWWYELRDGGDDPRNREHRFGLLTHGLGMKPAFKALKTVVALMPDSAKVAVSQPAKGVYRAQISSGADECSAYWTREGQASYRIPDRDLKGKLTWGALPQIEEGASVVTETPFVTCR